MAALESCPASAPAEEIQRTMARDGAMILTEALSPAALGALNAQLEPLIARTPVGGDDFSGRQTRRSGALVARAPLTRPLVADPRIVGAASRYLAPYTDKIILHLTQTIHIGPHSPAQTLHRDRLAWGGYLPDTIEPQFNTIWALSDFTAENGATRVVPGSHTWDADRRAAPDEKTSAEMPAGSVLLYSGSVLHSGGENRSDAPRLGLNITYCLGWLRQEENQYLSCPPHIARELEPELQELLGYTQGSYALGYYSDPEPAPDSSRDILPPEMALGRWPSSGGFSSTSNETLQELLNEELAEQHDRHA
ncbi:MAG: phytanoyl-CoA dioxygenase family protein [Pseudomonadota bacterium]